MENNKPAGLTARVRAWVAGIGVLTVLGLFVAGIVFWGGFNTAMEMTNREEFCIGCHEMKNNVYAEYQNTVHYSNRSGVRATCPDCHVPKEWVPKIIRKVQASKEVWGKITGIVDTPEKFEAHRLEMATREWARMKANNSQECRNCHNFEYFDYAVQGRRGANTHQQAFTEGKTCIDCHKGIAHKLPEVDQSIGAVNTHGAAPEVFHPPVAK
ncbi:cytochrome c-type protein NapC [Azonexus fungiphilus]|jgi:cytochrome c-type protein NapC|uniref:Cytochrome c-type protein n=1 Tax=Azonexus fungiphilus TaxID=146940 RepID=A0A495WG98_9RHOO|nr:NapC/NirT family cytochrome c [Azonexus fungiphilus]NHC05694.1 cytochrome c-type protein NapC [Azonexus fungiphilus]RKT60711.1 cytochrome c-type protein NapC [Azonexus fungiphilus]